MLPKLKSRVNTKYGHDGIVLEVGAGHFIVRYYDKGDYTIFINDRWEQTK